MTAHGYAIGDRVRVIGGDDPPIGSFGRVVHLEPDWYDGSLPVRVESEHDGDWWWPELHEIEPAQSAQSKAEPSIVEKMAMAHGMAWRLLLARTPRDRLEARGWFREDRRGLETWWYAADGMRAAIEIDGGQAYPYDFSDEERVMPLDIDDMLDFAAIAAEVIP